MDDAAQQIVRRFDLKPHPEGGFFREVYRSPLVIDHLGVPHGEDSQRRAATQIYYLLAAGQHSAFHRVKRADEIWHLYAGGPLELHVIDGEGRHRRHDLTTALMHGEPTAIVPAGCWQAARLAPGAAFAFAGCTVAPGFEFADFELAAADELAGAHPEHAALIRELARR